MPKFGERDGFPAIRRAFGARRTRNDNQIGEPCRSLSSEGDSITTHISCKLQFAFQIERIRQTLYNGC